MASEKISNSQMLNFQLAVFSYPDTYDLDPKSRVQREKRLDLSKAIKPAELQVNENYYIILNTQAELKGDFSMAFWYDDASFTTVESHIVGVKVKNTASQVTLVNLVRGRLNPISFERVFPDADSEATEPEVKSKYTFENLNRLKTERQNASFGKSSYLAVVQLHMTEEFEQKAASGQKAVLKKLEGFASANFPGVVETVLIDTPLGKTNHSLLVYFNSQADFINYVTMLKAEEFAKFLKGGFSEITICNATSRQQLENPQTLIRKSN
jgi:hypothetical protein